MDDGFRLRLADSDVRRVSADIHIRFRSGEQPSLALTQRRWVGETEMRWRLTRKDGGSGGEEVAFTAERVLTSGIVGLDLRTQAEAGHEPDLTAAFDLLASAHCVNVP